LYNIAEDPNEESYLLPIESDRAGIMKTDLNAWLVSVVRSLNGLDYS
jgi:hypothetical protein